MDPVMGFRTKLTTIHFKTTSRTNMTPQSTGGLPSTRATLSPSSCLPGDCPLLQTITLQTSQPIISVNNSRMMSRTNAPVLATSAIGTL